MKQNMGNEYGSIFIEMLMNGAICKEYMPNHAEDFSGGNEEYHYNMFASYMGSCGCYLMDKRLDAARREYYG